MFVKVIMNALFSCKKINPVFPVFIYILSIVVPLLFLNL